MAKRLRKNEYYLTRDPTEEGKENGLEAVCMFTTKPRLRYDGTHKIWLEQSGKGGVCYVVIDEILQPDLREAILKLSPKPGQIKKIKIIVEEVVEDELSPDICSSPRQPMV